MAFWPPLQNRGLLRAGLPFLGRRRARLLIEVGKAILPEGEPIPETVDLRLQDDSVCLYHFVPSGLTMDIFKGVLCHLQEPGLESKQLVINLDPVPGVISIVGARVLSWEKPVRVGSLLPGEFVPSSLVAPSHRRDQPDLPREYHLM